MAITVKEAQTLYVSYFGRPADFVGLQYWTGTDTLVGSLEQLAHSFYNSAEGKKYFPVDPATNQIDVTASINAIYANMFGRVPETAGFDYWYNEIASGKINLAEAAVAIYRGAQGKDALMVENKIAAATQFTDQVAASDKPSLYYGDQAFAKANEFLNTVTDTTDVTSAGFAAQVNAAVNAAEAAGAVAGEGGTFTLTAGAATGILTNEVNVGFTPEGKYLTAGNDVVDLSNWNGSGSVNIGDAFSNDNDKVAVMADDLAAGADLKLTSIENLEIVNAGVKAPVTLKGANFKGLEAIKLIGDATTLNVSDFTYGIKVDATTNADSIIGSNKADTINGGAGNDIITGNDGNDVLTGGNGADEFVVGTVKTAGVDQILDFSAEDKISMNGFVPNELKKFDASTFSTVNYKTLDSVLATFGPGGANVTKAGDVVIFSYDGKTYALLANGAFDEAKDALVDITGANVASLTESNFGEPTPAPQGKTYPTYADFRIDADFGYIAEGQQVGIATVTGAEAGFLAANKAYLDKIAAGGIEKVTSNIDVKLADGTGITTFDATAFETKLAADAVGSGIVMNITGGTGTDVIVASSFGGTINGSGGADFISLGAGADVVKFTSADAANAKTITNFGTDTVKDKLYFDVNVFTGATSASTFTAADGSNTQFADGNVYSGTADNIKKIKSPGSSATNKVTFAIATDTGEIYAVTGKGGSSSTVDTVVIGSVDADAAVAITSAVTFSDFILLA